MKISERCFSIIVFALFRLESGNFDSHLLQNIQSARNFILVLTSGALDRCMKDSKQKDWLHKEVVCALNSDCNIIPVFDNFSMPKSKDLPVAMRALTSKNGVNWVHDYQTACVDKIERFLKPQTIAGRRRTCSESNLIVLAQNENNFMEKIEWTDLEGMTNEGYKIIPPLRIHQNLLKGENESEF